MAKKNLQPKQQQPVIRNTTAMAITGATENLAQGAIPLYETYCDLETHICSYDGDDAE